ncbi:exported hypothetical protein [Candidatus Sulfopaludibacter sp. SbA4]|nr:exported hypothetical protein [Candidatus Sulfopaludibacter sp. SbA4]
MRIKWISTSNLLSVFGAPYFLAETLIVSELANRGGPPGYETGRLKSQAEEPSPSRRSGLTDRSYLYVRRGPPA